MVYTLPIICSILFRLDGWGKNDKFLPFIPQPKWGGINYTRYLIGVAVWLCTKNPIFIITYGIAISIPYGEFNWVRRLLRWEKLHWVVIGLAYGGASCCLINTFIVALIVFVIFYLSNEGIMLKNKSWFLDWSVGECLIGLVMTLYFVWR